LTSAHRRDSLNATGDGCELQLLAALWYHLQFLRVPVPEEVVGEVQLHSLCRTRRWRGFHGGAAVLLTIHGEPEHRLVGHGRRTLPTGHMSHCKRG
ncbi:Os02g0695800, partial [Oryza sativa Japonica Group]